MTVSYYSVLVYGIRGSPPPPTTKCAVFYQGGYEAQLLLNATGYATSKKWDLLEMQLRHFIPEEAMDDLETLEFQRYVTNDARRSQVNANINQYWSPC